VTINRAFWLGMAGVMLLAALTRFASPGVVEFRHDEATLSLLAQAMADGDGLALTGMPSSVGVPNPPVSVWVMALPYLISDDPLMATLYVAALNVAGVGLLYALVYRTLGRNPALVAGIAYAVNPWAIFYSRKIWAQDFGTPFLLLALLVGVIGFYEGRRWAKVACLPLLLFALQIHFAAWALLPVYVYLVLTQRPHPLAAAHLHSVKRGINTTLEVPSATQWRGDLGVRMPFTARGFLTALISIGLAILVMLPFWLGLSRTLQDDPNRLANAVDSDAPLRIDGRAVAYTLEMASTSGLDRQLSNALPYALDRTGLLPLLDLLAGAAFIGMSIVGAGLLWARDRRLAGLVLLWALLPALAFTLSWTPVYPHYFITVLPAWALLVGAGTLAARRGIVRSAAYGLLWAFALAAAFQFVHWRRLMAYVDTHATERFATPLHYITPIRDALRAYDDVIVLTDGMEIAYDQEPAMWTAMLHDSARCVRALTGDGRAVAPGGRFAVLVAPNAPDNPVGNLYANDSARTFPLRPGEGAYTLYEWNGDPPLNLPWTAATGVFSSGAHLEGYHRDDTRLTLLWRLWNPPAGGEPQDYQYFVHVLDAAGEKIDQRDERFWPGRYWCDGELFVTWTALSVPDTAATLRVGMYRLTPDGGFVNATVGDGATWVEIPLAP
jgi:hypothetical protein